MPHSCVLSMLCELIRHTRIAHLNNLHRTIDHLLCLRPHESDSGNSILGT
jgi:hypothetical protein